MAKKQRTLLARVGLGFLIAFLVALPTGFAFLEWSVQPSFCTNCHLMLPYYQSWQQSSHRDVSCVECHYEPGVVETLHGKIMALNMVVKYFTGAEGTKPWAEVADTSCMRSGCHSTRLLAGQVKFQPQKDRDIEIPFNHTPHLLEMRLSKKLRCTSCHSQIVQGEHLTVTSSTCFLCHFKGAAEEPKLSDCRTCHGPPERPIELGDFTFVHQGYLDRGVGCESCHPGVTRGSGEVPKHRCASCHGVVSDLEKYVDVDLMHQKHVTERKVDCLECHTEITHKLRPKIGTEEAATATAGGSGSADCDSCHGSSHGLSEQFFMGKGGRGVEETPSAMWLARVDCGGCHKAFPGVLPSAKGGIPATETACLSCHGPAFEGMMGRWQEAYASSAAAVAKSVDDALAAAPGGPHEAALRDAAHDVGLVLADGSRGVHNPWFARKLLASAHGKVQESRGMAPDAGFPLGPSFRTDLTCAMTCHMGIENTVVRRSGIPFAHGIHLGSGLDCNACHSVGIQGQPGSDHGRTLPEAMDCLKCHHDAKPPSPAAGRDCASCHVETADFLKGSWTPGVEGPQMMAEVTCDSCHGDPPAFPARPQVAASCAQCHDDESYPAMVEEWTADATAWIAEATARLTKVRAAAEEKGGTAAASLAAADGILDRVRIARPQHNILLFEEVKSLFDDAATAAEKASR